MLYSNFHPRSALFPVLLTALSLLSTSCEDNPVRSDIADSRGPVFDVTLTSAWTTGTVVSRSENSEISIAPVSDKTDGHDLYLVSENEILDSVPVPQNAYSRGTTITSATFPSTFGLSAICYNTISEESDLSGFGANLVCNVSVGRTGGDWLPAGGLDWPGSGRIRFIGYAPQATNDNGITHSDASVTPTLDFNVNTTVADQIDLLTAQADVSGKGGEKVLMRFSHALAAITVRSGDAMLAGEITEVTLSGIHGKGKLSLTKGVWNFDESTPDAIFTTPVSVKTDYKADNNPYASPGLNIAGTDDGLTFFMIPQDLESGENGATLTIKFKDKLSGLERTLKASIGGKDKSWKAGRLYTYSISSTGIIVTPIVKINKAGTEESAIGVPKVNDAIPYTGVVRDVDLSAYVKVTQVGAETRLVSVPFKMECSSGSDVEEAKWLPLTDSDKLNPQGPAEKKTGTLLLPAQPNFKTRQSVFSTLTPGTDIVDLSEEESANCYMVDAPGSYKFRTVYGNSLRNGNTNSSAYTINHSAADADKGMLYYPRHDNLAINGPEIEGQAGILADAFLLWNDSPGLVDNVELSADHKYISFRITPETIAEGNSVIALRNTDGDIVWSWHIWVTPLDWESNLYSTTNANDEIYNLAPSYLGYCSADKVGAKLRDMKLKFVFDLTDVGGDKIVYDETDNPELAFYQQGMHISLAGDNTYYMWGRKDAMPGGIYDVSKTSTPWHYYYPYTDGSDSSGEFTMLNKPIYDYLPEYQFTARRTSGDGANFGESIKEPHHFFLGEDRQTSYEKDGVTCKEGTNYRNHWHNSDGMPYVDGTIDVTIALTYDKTSEKATYGTETIPAPMYNAWNATANYYLRSDKIAGTCEPVTKTVFDPCPPGFYVPNANAYTGVLKVSLGDYYKNRSYDDNKPEWSDADNAWKLKVGSKEFKFYATGMRDMNVKSTMLEKLHKELRDTSWPAFSMITFISSSTLYLNGSGPTNGKGNRSFETCIFYLDNRWSATVDIYCGAIQGSNNSYGLTVWPAHY